MDNRMVARVGLLLLMALGIAVTVWLVIVNSSADVLQSFVAVGWGLLGVVLVRATMVATNGVAWGLLLAKPAGVRISVFVLLRWIREAINVLLPVVNVGGEMAAARVLTFWRVPIPVAVAGVLTDVLLQTVAQALFALAGALLLMRLVGLSLLPPVLLGIAVALLALGGFYLAQRHGGLRLVDRAIAAASKRLVSGHRVLNLHLHETMQTVWRRRSRVLIGLLVHLLAWSIGTFEVWIALRFMGQEVSLQQAMIIESLGAAISSAAFFIPGSWGVQEAGYIVVGHMLGVPTQSALALSFAKRVPDLALGIPGLLVWHFLEARRLLVPYNRQPDSQ
jgi:putative membrane protein